MKRFFEALTFGLALTLGGFLVACQIFPRHPDPALALAASITNSAPVSFQTAQDLTVRVAYSDGGGTGFIFKRTSVDGPRVFAWTAGHVAKHGNTPNVETAFRWNNQKTGKLVFESKVLFKSDKPDCAVLWVQADPKWYPDAPEWVNEKDVGTPLFSIGCMRGVFDGSISLGIIAQVIVNPRLEGWPWGNEVDQGTFISLPGSSGGPVFRLSDGKYVGIAVGMESTGIAFYTPTRSVWSVAPPWTWDGTNCPSDYALELLALKQKPEAEPLSLIIELK